MAGLPMLCIPMIFINYPLSSIVLHINLMFDLFMNPWWVPFYDFVCVPDNSFHYAKDKAHKLNFVTLFGLYVGIFTLTKTCPFDSYLVNVHLQSFQRYIFVL